MINILKFDMSIEYKFAYNIAAQTCFKLFHNLPECMILYRHQISEYYIWSKFGCNHPDKIDFEKLNGKNLLLLHTDVYKEDTNKIINLIDYCLEKKIEMWIPITTSNFWANEEVWLDDLKKILNSYQHISYDFTGMNYKKEVEIEPLINERIKPILREIKLRNLFN